MQNELAGAKSELSAAAQRLTEAERAYALDASPVVWKNVTASREANEKAATRLRALEAMADEKRKEAEAEAEAQRVAGLENELIAAEKNERLEAVDASDRDLFVGGIAAIARALANAEARRMARLGASEEANRLRLALGRPTKAPDHFTRIDPAALLSVAVGEGVAAGKLQSAAHAKLACAAAVLAVDTYKAGADDDAMRKNTRITRLRALQENTERNGRQVERRVKERGALEAEAVKLDERQARRGDCGPEAAKARKAIADHDDIDRQLAATMRHEASEIEALKAEIAAWGTP